MKIVIKHRTTQKVLFECEAEDIKSAVSKAVAAKTDLIGADLRYANLGGVDFRGVDLRGVDPRGANLRDADFRGADLSDFEVPVIDNIHQAVLAACSVEGALDMYAWHTCETTHCRAGWVVTLAGEAGKRLEGKIGTPTAAMFIYIASDPTLDRLPDLYCGNEDAMEDMRRLAKPSNGAE